NASRTLLCSLATLDWDDELLDLFGVPREVLPEIRPSGADFGQGELLGLTLPVRGVAGDQQAALFAAGGAKATFGTGAFVLVETDAEPRHGVLRTAAARLGAEPPLRAPEGAVFVTGAALLALGERRPSPVGERFEPATDVSELYAAWRDALGRLLSVS